MTSNKPAYPASATKFPVDSKVLERFGGDTSSRFDMDVGLWKFPFDDPCDISAEEKPLLQIPKSW